MGYSDHGQEGELWTGEISMTPVDISSSRVNKQVHQMKENNSHWMEFYIYILFWIVLIFEVSKFFWPS